MIEGIDVSYFQGRPDYQVVKDSGRRFVYVKASGGVKGYDPRFDAHVRAALPHLTVGAYHVLKCEQPIRGQCVNFYDRANGLGEMRTQLPPAIDFELFGPDGAVPRKELVPRALEALRITEELFSCTPVLYTYPWFLKTVLDAAEGDYSELARFPLWYATYGKEPNPPGPWEKVTIWQYAGNNGKCPGVTGACDLNRFLGTDEEFRRFTGDPFEDFNVY